ncbi:hypothetical protein [Mycobacterium sp.]|uniref:hypothetical protein n=1 Tax=Mycobacterium sp. TaxID=1785 RepID=UPI0026374283|nr:hypothetical protein [Mycobacterium sp.]
MSPRTASTSSADDPVRKQDCADAHAERDHKDDRASDPGRDGVRYGDVGEAEQDAEAELEGVFDGGQRARGDVPTA